MTFIKLRLFPLRLFFQKALFRSCAFYLVFYRYNRFSLNYKPQGRSTNKQTASTVFMVLYLWGSSCGDDDVSPTHWLSLDKDHLHSAIPMFGKMLGFSNNTHSTTFQSGLWAAFRPAGGRKKELKELQLKYSPIPRLRQSSTRGKIWKVDLLGGGGRKKLSKHHLNMKQVSFSAIRSQPAITGQL